MSGEERTFPQDTDDKELLAAVQRREPQALAALYDRYGRISFALAFRIVNDHGIAEDVVQEAFLRLWHQAGSYQASRGTVRSWLLSIVHHRAIDVLRSREHRSERDLPLERAESVPGSTDVWQQVSRSLDREVIHEALASIPAVQREAIELAYFGGYTYTEIAAMMNVPLGTVKSRLRLGLERMRAYLERRHIEAPR